MIMRLSDSPKVKGVPQMRFLLSTVADGMNAQSRCDFKVNACGQIQSTTVNIFDILIKYEVINFKKKSLRNHLRGTIKFQFPGSFLYETYMGLYMLKDHDCSLQFS